ncbi:MAG: ScyD/ScyE family protein [Gemmatimonadota bacterium]
MRNGVAVVGIVLALALAAMPLDVDAVAAQEAATTVMGELNGPMGVFVTSDGSVWVIDTGVGGDEVLTIPNPGTGVVGDYGFGESSRILRLAPDGEHTEVARLPSLYLAPGDGAGGSRVAVLDGTVYATVGAYSVDPPPGMASVVRIDDGRAIQLVNIWDFESSNNPDGLLPGSNPYGLAVGPDGDLWMTDAAGNALYRIDPATGETEVVAVFEGVPSPIPHADRGGVMETDPVPTGVTFDEEGNAYVSLLPGFPFAPGSSKVVKVTSDGVVTDYATDLTMLTDVRMAPDGHLYAVSIGLFTDQGPVPNSGAIIRLQEGTASEAVVSDLLFPTSIDFNEAGDAFLTINGIGAPGTGEVVKFEGLASGSSSRR